MEYKIIRYVKKNPWIPVKMTVFELGSSVLDVSRNIIVRGLHCGGPCNHYPKYIIAHTLQSQTAVCPHLNCLFILILVKEEIMVRNRCYIRKVHEILTKEDYVDNLNSNIKKCASSLALGCSLFFQLDNDLMHTSKLVQTILKDTKRSWECPSQRSYLNSINNLW